MALNTKFIADELAKSDDDETFYEGLEIAAYMRENPEKVPDELRALFDAIKPIKTRNTLAEFEDVDTKVKMLLAFPTELIKDKELLEMFKRYKSNFKEWVYQDPKNYIPRLHTRRRGSVAQQEKYRGEGGQRRTRRKRRSL